MNYLLLSYCLFGIVAEVLQVQASKTILIGAIFSRTANARVKDDYEGFKTAIDFINTDEKQRISEIRFEGLAEFADSDEDLDNVLKAISLVDRGVVAIIGPSDVLHLEAIQRLCPQLQTPQLAPSVSGLTLSFNPCNFEYLLRMSPSDGFLFNAVADVIKFFNWTKVAVLASRDSEGREALGLFKDFLEVRNITLLRSWLFHLAPDVTRPSIRRTLDSIRKAEARIIVVRCRSALVRTVLQEAKKKDMLEDYAWIWVENNFEEEYLFPKGFMACELNGLIAITQASGHGRLSQSINKYWRKTGKIPPTKPSVGRVIDSVLAVTKAVRDALRDGVQISSEKKGRICTESHILDDQGQGANLSSYLRKVNMDGFMGKINFNQDGSQSKSSGIYDIVNFNDNGINKIGIWTPKEKLKMFKDKNIVWNSGRTDAPRDSINILRNKILRVVTFRGPPFTFPKHDNVTGLVRGDEFEGAVIELLNKLKEILQFDYVIYLSPDGTVDNWNRATNSWGGVIGELVNKKADIAVGPITITSHRSQVVDFTQPFMATGLGVVMATEESDPTFFGFLKPFSLGLWTVIIGAVFGMALVSSLFSFASPYGFYGRFVQSRTEKVKASHVETKDNLSLFNSIWSSAAYYLGQGPDGLHPVSASGRAAMAVWWFCITILTSTYTANLTAYLTTNRMQTPLVHVNDLSQQNKIDYGLVENSQTQKFFEDSQMSRYLIMWEYMKLRRGLVPNTSSGTERVLKGKYAFIHDAPVLQYLARKKYCGKMKLIGGFDERVFGQMSYGFALPKGSPYTTLINVELLKMQQRGVIKKYLKKWMIDKTPCALLDEAEREEGSETDTYRMGFMDMLGVFFFVIGGVVIGFLLLIIEWLAAPIKDSKIPKSRLSFLSAIQNRTRRFYRHVKNPQAKKLDLLNPPSATTSTQTENPYQSTRLQYDAFREQYRPATTVQASRPPQESKPRPPSFDPISANTNPKNRWRSEQL